jgi:hypothetical protein
LNTVWRGPNGYSGWLHLIFLFHKYIIFDLTITKTSKKVEGIKLIWSSAGQQGGGGEGIFLTSNQLLVTSYDRESDNMYHTSGVRLPMRLRYLREDGVGQFATAVCHVDWIMKYGLI